MLRLSSLCTFYRCQMCVEREVLPASMAAMRAGRRGAPRMVQHVVRVLHTLHCRQQGAAEAEELVQLRGDPHDETAKKKKTGKEVLAIFF